MSVGEQFNQRLASALRFARRRWAIGLIGMVLSYAGALAALTAPGVYQAKVDLILVTPASAAIPNTLGVSSGSLIAVAGMLQREVSGGPEEFRMASYEIGFLDQGITSGVSVRLDNRGGQWFDNFEIPMLHLESVDRREDVARTQMEAVIQQIQARLRAREDAKGVAPENRIAMRLSPEQYTVNYRVGERKRAAAATLVLGAGLTIAMSLFVEWPRRPWPVSAASFAPTRAPQ